MTTGALDLPDTGRLELDDAKDELRKVLRAHRRAITTTRPRGTRRTARR